MKNKPVTILFLLLLCSCSLPTLFLPIITDPPLEAFITEEGSKILEVSENVPKAALYKFFLVKFPREDILGLSLGERRIFIAERVRGRES